MSFRERRWWHQIISHILLTADVPSCQPQRDARVAAEFAETSPSISPDGRWLAYASNETGIREAYVRPFPEVAESRVRVSTDGGTEPLWSHGGSELFYRNRNGDLVVATVATTPGFVVRQREVLFPYAGDVQSDNAHLFAVLPDDQRFVVIRAVGSGGLATHGDLVLVENWMEEVRAQGRN
jgi:hypothetical protein